MSVLWFFVGLAVGIVVGMGIVLLYILVKVSRL